jgi:hypothetical protein
MSNDKYGKIQGYFEPKYDSDEDLDEQTRKKIKDSPRPDQVRSQAWEGAGVYPKLKRMVKGAVYGDKRKPSED